MQVGDTSGDTRSDTLGDTRGDTLQVTSEGAASNMTRVMSWGITRRICVLVL